MSVLHIYDAVGNREKRDCELQVGDFVGLDDLNILTVRDRTRIYRKIRKGWGTAFRFLKSSGVARFTLKVYGSQCFFDRGFATPPVNRTAWMEVNFNGILVERGVYNYDLTKE